MFGWWTCLHLTWAVKCKQHRWWMQCDRISALSTWWFWARWPQCNTRCIDSIISILRFTSQDIIKPNRKHIFSVKIHLSFFKWILNQMVFWHTLMRFIINALHQWWPLWMRNPTTWTEILNRNHFRADYSLSPFPHGRRFTNTLLASVLLQYFITETVF